MNCQLERDSEMMAVDYEEMKWKKLCDFLLLNARSSDGVMRKKKWQILRDFMIKSIQKEVNLKVLMIIRHS